jgi:DNA-directed RNA polymerase III subunit RPC3
MLIETCYKALYNAMTRAIQDKETNKRLMEKSMRLQFIVDAMKERGESEDAIHEV